MRIILASRYKFISFEILPNTKTASVSRPLKVAEKNVDLLFHDFVIPLNLIKIPPVGLPGIEPGLHAPHACVLPVYYSPFLLKL